MWRKIISSLTLLAACAAQSAAPREPIEVRSEPVQMDGATQKQIFAWARTCVAKTIRNEAVQIQDSSATSPLVAPIIGGTDTQQALQGGNALLEANEDTGTIVANSRAKLRIWGSDFVLQSTFTVDVRDGKFRTTHTDVASAMASTGYAKNDGFTPATNPGAFVKQYLASLTATSEKFAACVVATRADDF